MMSILLILWFVCYVTNGELINPGTPNGVDISFDCDIRQFTYEYGMNLQNRHGNFISLYDALQLNGCNVTKPINNKYKHNGNINRYKLKHNIKADSCTYYIDPVNGNDSNTGTSINNALLTIDKGISVVRTNRIDGEHCTINLLNGTFYQSDTIYLNEKDSNLTIQNYGNDVVYISGGILLKFENDWQKYGEYMPYEWKKYPNMNNVYGRALNSDNNDLVYFIGVYNTYDECESAIKALNVNETDGLFRSLVWHDLNFQGWEGHCYGVRDFSWQPMVQDDVYSGRLTGDNIWYRKVSNMDNKDMDGLRVNDKRGIRARYPDNIPEIMMQYDPNSGWITYDTNWLPPLKTVNGTMIIINASDYSNGDVYWPMEYVDGYSC